KVRAQHETQRQISVLFRLWLSRLCAWWKNSVQAQIDGLRAVMVIPSVAQTNERAGAAGGPVAKQHQRIAQFGIVDIGQRSRAEVERRLQSSDQFFLRIGVRQRRLRRGRTGSF